MLSYTKAGQMQLKKKKNADLCSASRCKASHFCFRVESLTSAISPSSPGWASTSRGPSSIMESILRLRSVRSLCKSCMGADKSIHDEIKMFFYFYTFNGSLQQLLPDFVTKRKLVGELIPRPTESAFYLRGSQDG